MAGKFKVPSLKELELQEQAKEQPKEKTVVGSWLLEDKEPEKSMLSITNIRRDNIIKNPNNQYSITGIPSLAESIKHYGLVQPLHVLPMDNGTYKLLGGERRLTAIDMLIEDDSVPEWTSDTLIPCVVKGIDDLDLNLSDENKEQYAIITTNKEQRIYSDADRYMEIQKWKQIIAELRENGVEYLEHYDEDGNEVPINIKGEKTRDILSQATGISRGQINKFENIHNNGSEELKGALLEGKISVSEADKAVKDLSTGEQDKLAHNARQGLSTDVVDEQEDTSIIISQDIFTADVENIVSILHDNEVKLDKKAQDKYYRLIEQLEKLLRGHK